MTTNMVRKLLEYVKVIDKHTLEFKLNFGMM